MTLTIATPSAHIADANHLAMVLAYGPADGLTYRTAQWQDAAGNLYSCASAEVSSNFIANSQATLARPAWDVEPYVIDMAGATNAQSLVVLWMDGSATTSPLATPGAITAIAGMDGLAALALMGLSLRETAVLP